MKINERCYVVYGLTTISPWMVNSGFVVGDSRTLVVDCGGNYLSAQTIHGYATAIRPSNSLLAINTEPHFDHVGGNCFFRALDIDIYGHEGIDRTDEQLSAVRDGYNDSVLDNFRRGLREGDLVFLRTRAANPNKRFREDFAMDLGGIKVQVLMTPGHTLENASVYVASLSTLYCGDTIVNGYVPNLGGGSIDEWHLWLKSLDKIEQLAPDTIVPGHGEVMRGAEVKREIDRTRTILEEAIKRGAAPTESG